MSNKSSRLALKKSSSISETFDAKQQDETVHKSVQNSNKPKCSLYEIISKASVSKRNVNRGEKGDFSATFTTKESSTSALLSAPWITKNLVVGPLPSGNNLLSKSSSPATENSEEDTIYRGMPPLPPPDMNYYTRKPFVEFLTSDQESSDTHLPPLISSSDVSGCVKYSTLNSTCSTVPSTAAIRCVESKNKRTFGSVTAKDSSSSSYKDSKRRKPDIAETESHSNFTSDHSGHFSQKYSIDNSKSRFRKPSMGQKGEGFKSVGKLECKPPSKSILIDLTEMDVEEEPLDTVAVHTDLNVMEQRHCTTNTEKQSSLKVPKTSYPCGSDQGLVASKTSANQLSKDSNYLTDCPICGMAFSNRLSKHQVDLHIHECLSEELHKRDCMGSEIIDYHVTCFSSQLNEA